MIPIFASFSFEGVERWQIWFDNPNKAAILFAEMVIIGVWLAQCRKSIWFWIGYVVANAAAFALLHTMSRGGLLACGVGIAFVLRKCWSKKRLILLVLSLVLLSMAAIHLKVHRRCLHGVVEEDASIKNRIIMWSCAPDMFRASPMGWGLGNSGTAYMKWFQPTDMSERYRTLVNSHLTWLVEFGWGIGVIYLWVWFSLFWMGWKVLSQTDQGLCMGLTTCLFTGGVFSSVLETVWLWIFPVLVFCISSVKAPLHGFCLAKGFFAVLVVTLLAVCGFVAFPVSDGPAIFRFQNTVRCGEGVPVVCLFPDTEVLGGELYMREFRGVLNGRSGTVEVVREVKDIPQNADIIVLAGKQCIKMDDVITSHPDKKLLIISPPFELWDYLAEKVKNASDRVHVLVGELSDTPLQEDYDNVVVVSGANRYIPGWADYMFDFYIQKCNLLYGCVY